MVKNNSIAVIAAAVVLLAFVAPYFSPQGFAVARNQQDFTATGVVLPEPIVSGLGFNVQAIFANLGDVSGSHVVYRYEILNAYNKLYSNEGSTDLLAGQTKTLTLYVDDELAAGTYTLKLIVDSDNAYIESDETNNIYNFGFKVPYP